jgi:hypothetical protein
MIKLMVQIMYAMHKPAAHTRFALNRGFWRLFQVGTFNQEVGTFNQEVGTFNQEVGTFNQKLCINDFMYF